MIFLCKIVPEKYMWIASILGAVLHNIGQTIAALILMGTFSVIAYLPFLMLSGCIAGLFKGLCASFLTSRLKIK